eukprot:s1782_g13.t1
MWNARFDKRKKSSFLAYSSHYEYGFHHKTLGSSSQEEKPKDFVLATDDEWVINEANMELIRVHKQMRKAEYEPKDGLMPIPLEFLDHKHKTIMEFSTGKRRSSERPASKSTESWRGRTVGSPEDMNSKGKPEDSSRRQEQPEALFRIEGIILRGSIFVDHEEIQFGTKAYLALVIIDGYAEKATVRQAVKKVAWARNCQLTVSGYAPLEIATDREKNLVV